MTRAAIIIVALIAIAIGGFFIGKNWNAAEDADKKADTLERIQDADKSSGDEKDDRAWVRDFLDSLQSRD